MSKVVVLAMAPLLVAQPAVAMPRTSVSALHSPLARVSATDCRGPIATEKHPIVGEKLLANMRREGKLPDKFVCGRCAYDLAGDPGAAYYVKTCR